MKFKKIIAVICAQALMLSAAVSAFASPSKAEDFTDIKESDYFYPAVEWGVEDGIVYGVDDTHFAPTGEVTRAQAVTFLWRMAGMPESLEVQTFKDVEKGSWYEKAVNWAVMNDITAGTGEDTFSPDAICDRAMCITLIYRLEDGNYEPIDAMDESEIDEETLEGMGYSIVKAFIKAFREGQGFTDVKTGDYFELPVVWASISGIITTENTDAENRLFNPNSPCVRSEMVSFLYQTKMFEDQVRENSEFSVDTDESNGELHSSIQHEVASPEWVTKLPSAQDENTTQLFVIAGMGIDKTTATVSMHERDEDGGWKQILSTPAFVGKNGLCLDKDHKEGCGQTPIGVYHFNKAFGIADDPGCALDYTKVTDDTYWSGDMRDGMRYNEMVDINDYPDLDMENSEHIVDYEYQYQYCLNISFNEDGTPGRGSAIFLHCLGPVKPYTGGCVALPENIMKMVMQRVHEDCVVVIDTLDNMGGSL